MSCPHCHAPAPVGSLLCATCGASLIGEVARVTTPPPLARPPLSRPAPPPPGAPRVLLRTQPLAAARPAPPAALPREGTPPLGVQLAKLPAGPVRELFEAGGVLDGKFALDREVGRGGMGYVFAGKDLSLGRPVAVKLLPPHYND
ncbi:MAG: hypothetical protein FJ138_10010, partial [Deltaproteobacteria bacterium]|nr:hypothetical protein [Deltaproteobacteria bacterium]